MRKAFHLTLVAVAGALQPAANAQSATVTASIVPRTPSFIGVCPVKIAFDADITVVALPGKPLPKVQYRIIRSDSSRTDARIASFARSGSQSIDVSWTMGRSLIPTTEVVLSGKPLKEDLRDAIEEWKDKSEADCEKRHARDASRLASCLADVRQRYAAKTTESHTVVNAAWVAIEVLKPRHFTTPRAHFTVQCVDVPGSGKTTEISSEKFWSPMQAVLDGTKIQISQTTGDVVGGDPETHDKWMKQQIRDSIEDWKEQAEAKCETTYANNPTRRAQCMEVVEKRYTTKTKETVIPTYLSFVRWSDKLLAVSQQSGRNMDTVYALDLPVWRRDLSPGEVAGVLAASTVFLGGLVTVDAARCLVNDVNTTINGSTFKPALANGAMSFTLLIDSKHPTLICEAHVGYFFGAFDDWSDGAMPDQNFKDMRLGVRLIPMVTADGKLSYYDAYVDFDADIEGGAGELIDFFTNYEAHVKHQLTTELRRVLLTEPVRAAFSDAMMGLVRLEIKVDHVQRVDIRHDNIILTY